MPNPVVHFEITGGDGQKLFQFYRNLFGWKVDANNPMEYGIVDTDSGGKGIAGGISKAQEGNGSSVTFYVEVDDPQASLDQATKLGGKVVMPVSEIPGMVIMAQFADPEGNVIGLVKSNYPPQQ